MQLHSSLMVAGGLSFLQVAQAATPAVRPNELAELIVHRHPLCAERRQGAYEVFRDDAG